MSIHFKPAHANIVCHTTEERASTTNNQSHVTCQDCIDEIRTVDLARRSQICKGCGNPKSPGKVICTYCYGSGDSPFKDWRGRFNEWVISAASNKLGAQ